MTQKNLAIVVSKKTRDIYKYHGDTKYENITTGAKGKIKDEDAKRHFAIPITLNSMVEKNPSIITLISKLSLQLEEIDENVNTALNSLNKK
jgi:hypothetical protein